MKNIGFISFRFAGTDGVSLETAKWADVFTKMGHNCFYMAGELDRPKNVCFLDERLHFQHSEIRKIYNDCFDYKKRPKELTDKIHHFREELKKSLYAFINKFNLDMLIPQNALTIPLNIPLALAITEVIAETGIPVIAHHHDFFWERKRFLTNCIWDYINQAYPPHLPSIHHVVINTSAQNQLALRSGISSTLIPNVMDFENGPVIDTKYSANLRAEFGIKDDELFILQPTRVVQRKGIEHAIELVARLDRKAVLVISHASGDEGFEYEQRVVDYAKLLGIRALFVSDLIGEQRGTTPDGRKIYLLEDVYPHADLVTYPSLIEGFGNAFLETLLFKKQIVVNNYSIYSTDIKPKGFQVIEMEDYISDKTIIETNEYLNNKKRRDIATEHNYKIGMKFYSYAFLESQLKAIMTSFWGNDGKSD